jgi:hypothetical protein
MQSDAADGRAFKMRMAFRPSLSCQFEECRSSFIAWDEGIGYDVCVGQQSKKEKRMKFKYCRIQGKELAANTRAGKGIFSMLNQMVTDGVMDEEDVGLFKEIDSWFVEELPFPPQCKRQEKVICYFKTENSDMMMKMIRPLLWLLERYNHAYYVVYTNFPGEIVYEDQYQIVVKVDENVVIEDVQASWSPED